MPYLKQIERSAIPTFCPNAGLLALGTAAGAIDMSFSSNSVLEIFCLEFSSQSEPLQLLASIPVQERFNRLAWASRPDDSNSTALGLIAGGFADGSIMVWDPVPILDKAADKALLSKMQQSGAVRGLEFNSFTPNLLAAGAADGDLCIWDLTNPSEPVDLYPSLKSAQVGPGGTQAGNEITYLSWNHKVQQIVATCNANGTSVVWDLRRQRPVFSFKDSTSPRRCSALQWNPEIATQLIVASDDDHSPTLQMWDLRNSVSPLREFVGHTKGVLGMAWCPHDASLLLSSGKDSRTICWDVQSGDTVCELPVTANWNYDVQWSPLTPGIFSTASFDGKVSICNLHACTVTRFSESFNADFSVSTVTTGEATPLKRAPMWMRRPVGATFGFGGRLVTFTHQKHSSTDATGQVQVSDTAVISVSQVVTEHDLVTQSEAFEAAIAGCERGTLRDYCARKAAACTVPEEAETWGFLAILFEDDARIRLLTRLGFNDMLTAKTTTSADAGSLVAALETLGLADGHGKSDLPSPQMSPDAFFANSDGKDFFDNLPEEVVEKATAPSASAPAAQEPSGNGHPEEHLLERHGPTEVDEEIQRSLVVGNYEHAVEACLRADRPADALLIANIASADLFKRTMNRYVRTCPRPYLQLMLATAERDYLSLVKARPVGAWRETLAILATYSGADQWSVLCDALASRLASAGMTHAALLCYICAANVDAAVSHWAKHVSASGAGVFELQDVIEKAVVFGMATSAKKASAGLSDLVTVYASLLASQGRISTALEYLEFVPGEASTSVAVLKDRMYRSGAEAARVMHPPPFPFILEDIQPAPETLSAARAGQQQAAAAAAASAHNPYGQSAYSTQAAYGSAAAQPTQAATSAYGSTYTQPLGAQYAGSTQYGGAAAYPAAAPTQYAAASSYPAQQPTAAQAQYAQPYASTPASSAYPGQQQASGQSAYQGYNANPYGTAAQSATQYAPTAAAAQSSYNTGYPQSSNFYPAPAEQAPVYQVKGSSAHAPKSTTPVAPNFSVAPLPAPIAPAAPPPAPTPAAPPAASFQPVAVTPPQGAQAFTTLQHPSPPQGAFYPTATATSAGYPAVPGMPPKQPTAPVSQHAPAPPTPPPGPPANISVATADTSNVSPEQRPIVGTLTNLYNSCVVLANNPAKKKEVEDNSKKLGQMFYKLNAHEMSEGVVAKVLQLCQAIDAGDWHSANGIQVQMATTDWEECGFWLTAVKRLIKMRQGAPS